MRLYLVLEAQRQRHSPKPFHMLYIAQGSVTAIPIPDTKLLYCYSLPYRCTKF